MPLSFHSLLSRARVALLALPLFALASSGQVACGGKTVGSGTTTDDVTAQGGGSGSGGWTDYGGGYGGSDGFTYGGYGGYGYGYGGGGYGGYGYGGYP